MNKLLKVLLSIFALGLSLIIIAIIVVSVFIDPNDFKVEIAAAVKESTGRELTIEGDLELSIFPWIGLSTGKLLLSNTEEFTDKPFAEIAESNVKVKLIPLLSKEVKVSRIILKGLVLNLVKNKQGNNNWDDLNQVGKQPKTGKQQTTNDSASDKLIPLAALAIEGISIEQGKIVWDDQQQGKYTEINGFNFITDELVFGKPIGVDLSFSVISKDPAFTESLSLTTDLIINESLDHINLTQINIESVTAGKEIPGEQVIVTLLADMIIDLSQQTLDIPRFNLKVDDLTLTARVNGTQLIDNPSFNGLINIAEFNLATVMKNSSITAPEMQDTTAMNKVSMHVDFQSNQYAININELLVKLDDTTMKGAVKISDFDHPNINFNLKVDAIDVDHYLPIETKNSPPKPAIAKAVAATSTLFPVETLRRINANGEIRIEKLKIKQLNMNNVSFKLKAKDKIINTQHSIKHFYQGSYSGNTLINMQGNTPRLTLNHKLVNVQIESLLKDKLGKARMTGIVNASANFAGQGNTEKALKSSLNGKFNFNFTEGIIKGFNLQKIINQTKSFITGNTLFKTDENDQTLFSVIKGSANITNGLIRNNDLYAEVSKLRVNGKGTAHLLTEKIDYAINTKLLKKEGTATKPEKIKGIPVIINVGGTFSNPSYSLDIASMLAEKHKEKINKKKDKLLKKLDEKLGHGVGNLIKKFF